MMRGGLHKLRWSFRGCWLEMKTLHKGPLLLKIQINNQLQIYQFLICGYQVEQFFILQTQKVQGLIVSFLQIIDYQNQIIMGNSNSFQELQTQPASLHKQWEVVSKIEQVELAHHRQSNYEGEIRVLPIDPKRQIKDEIKLYQKRLLLSGPVVQCYYYQQMEPRSFGICGSEQSIKVLTQKIVPWKKLKHHYLTLEEIIYTVKTAVEGYEILHDLVGAFEITENMFGVNNAKQLKVWLNENFASNHVSRERAVILGVNSDNPQLGSTKRGMVKNILDVIGEKLKNNSHYFEYCALKKKIMEGDRFLDFESARTFVKVYVEEKDLVVPQQIELRDYVNSQYSSPRRKGLSPLASRKKEGGAESLPGLNVLSKEIKQPKSSLIPHQQHQQEQKYQHYHNLVTFHPLQLTEEEEAGRLFLQQGQQPKDLYQQLLENPNFNTTESIYKTFPYQKDSVMFQRKNSDNYNQNYDLDKKLEKYGSKTVPTSYQNYQHQARTKVIFKYQNHE